MEGEIEPLHLRLEKAELGHWAHLRKCLRLAAEPPFRPGARLPLETRLFAVPHLIF
jgi:hypothetical protein